MGVRTQTLVGLRSFWHAPVNSIVSPAVQAKIVLKETVFGELFWFREGFRFTHHPTERES